MRIHALPTGQVVVKQAFLHPRPGVRRRLDLFLSGPWSDPMPIRAWLIEHGEERILIDMGETAQVKDAPFARHTVTPQDELPLALRAVGLACEDVTTAVVTHLHPDHFHGAVHLTTSVLVNEAEWADAMSFRGQVIQRLTGVSLPGGIDFRPVALDDGPFGAFAASRRLTTDGRVLLVYTPGHTRGHTSVIAVDDDGRHVLLAGDATDTLEQLHARRPDAITSDPDVQVQTIDRILAHAGDHATIYLRHTTPTPSTASRRARRSRSQTRRVLSADLPDIDAVAPTSDFTVAWAANKSQLLLLIPADPKEKCQIRSARQSHVACRS